MFLEAEKAAFLSLEGLRKNQVELSEEYVLGMCTDDFENLYEDSIMRAEQWLSANRTACERDGMNGGQQLLADYLTSSARSNGLVGVTINRATLNRYLNRERPPTQSVRAKTGRMILLALLRLSPYVVNPRKPLPLPSGPERIEVEYHNEFLEDTYELRLMHEPAQMLKACGRLVIRSISSPRQFRTILTSMQLVTMASGLKRDEIEQQLELSDFSDLVDWVQRVEVAGLKAVKYATEEMAQHRLRCYCGVALLMLGLYLDNDGLRKCGWKRLIDAVEVPHSKTAGFWEETIMGLDRLLSAEVESATTWAEEAMERARQHLPTRSELLRYVFETRSVPQVLRHWREADPNLVHSLIGEYR